MKHSTKAVAVKKPYLDFPLFPHATGRWAKKVRGKLHYFGKTSTDPKGQAALTLWLEQKDELLAGRTPREKTDGLTIAEMCNRFLTAKQDQLDVGEITIHTWNKHKITCDKIVKQFGKNRLVIDLASEDFEALRNAISKNCNLVTIGSDITRVRVVFKYAYDSGLIDRPIRFGPQFKRPSKKAMRIERSKQLPRLFEAADINRMLKAATPSLKAMILLAINCGFGNADCATLTIRSIDSQAGWINFPRPKTGINRRCPIWKETIEALATILAKRKEPKNEAHNELVFVTKQGGSFSKDTPDNPISKEFTKLLKALDLKQKFRGFYSLRHTFRTVADEAHDQPACDALMGHARDDMASIYRERIDDTRLRAVADYVHAWLFGKEVSGNG